MTRTIRMRADVSKIVALTLIVAAACSASPNRADSPAVTAASQSAPRPAGLQIKLTTVYVDDQDKALQFYTDVLGFAKKDDVRNGPYRWLTVTSPGDAEGTELQLALDDNPAAKAYQEAMFAQSQPAIMLFTDDLQRDYKRIKARGGEFTMPPTDISVSIIAQLEDTCGNLIQLTELSH